jgi:hypothetical protein
LLRWPGLLLQPMYRAPGASQVTSPAEPRQRQQPSVAAAPRRCCARPGALRRAHHHRARRRRRHHCGDPPAGAAPGGLPGRGGAAQQGQAAGTRSVVPRTEAPDRCAKARKLEVPQSVSGVQVMLQPRCLPADRVAAQELWRGSVTHNLVAAFSKYPVAIVKSGTQAAAGQQGRQAGGCRMS